CLAGGAAVPAVVTGAACRADRLSQRYISDMAHGKRPERLASCLPDDWGTGYPNVWWGVRVENRRWRLETLAAIPAIIHFASFEPLLQGLGDLTPWLPTRQWAIIGGESGPTRRPMALPWLLRIVEQCQRAEIPVFVKQDVAFRDGQ